MPGTPDQPTAVNSIPRGQRLQWKQNIGDYRLSREFSANLALLVVDKLLQRFLKHTLSFSSLIQRFIQFSSVQSLSHVRLFATPWTAAHQASLSITNSRSLPTLRSIESVMPSSYLILCRPLLLLPSIFPTIRVFFK